MSMFNIVSDGYHGMMRALGVEKKPAPTAPAGMAEGLGLKNMEKNAEKPAEAASLKQTEKLEKNAGPQGTAQLLAVDTSSEIDAWHAARGKGSGIDFSGANQESKLGRVIFLNSEGPYSKRYSPEQRKNIESFMKEVQPLSNRLNPSHKGDILKLLDDAIKTHGISDKQMDLIANGKFTAQSYVTMANNGDPIG